MSIDTLAQAAPAKVNLALSVLGRGEDGWHDLESIVVTLGWHDLITVRLDSRGTGCHLHMAEAPPDLPADGRNLALAAAEQLALLSGFGFSVRLHKRLPLEAGLGGGSSDAATVLRAGSALLAAAGRPVAVERLSELALALGSDVPALLRGGTLHVRGRGERLDRLPPVVLDLAVAVAGRCSTAQVFAAMTEEERRDDGRAAALLGDLRAGRDVDPSLCGSALEAAACRVAPELGASLAQLRQCSPGVLWHLTGSGGAAFAVATSAEMAGLLARRASALGLRSWAGRTVAALA